MQFHQITPCPALQPYVHCFWHLDSENAAGSTDTLFPRGQLEWVFNLGAATLVSVLNGQPLATPPTELLGQVTKACTVRVQGRNVLLGVRFLPHAAGLFLRSSVASLSDTVTDLAGVFGTAMPRLQEQLLAAPTRAAQVDHLQCFLLRTLDHAQLNTAGFRRLDFALRRLLAHPQDVTVAMVAARYGVSTRYLHELFLAFVGIPPKQFLKIIRLQRSVTCLHQSPASLTAVAYASGYSDQAHFIRDFKSLTGLTPSQYVPQAFPLNGPVG